MKRKRVFISLAVVAVAAAVLSACGGGAAPTTTTTGAPPPTSGPPSTTVTTTSSSNKPQYGGTVSFAVTSESSRGDLFGLGHWAHINLSFNRLWDGDWTKGPAGGYGTGETDWGAGSTNIPSLHIGHLAESWRFEVDSAKQQVTTIVTIRKGIHFAKTGTEAGKLVNGRELTIDDVVYNENEFLHNPASFNLQLFGYIKDFQAVKGPGPNEFSITLPFYDQLGGIMRLFDNMVIFPPELEKKYGAATGNQGFNAWQNLVGTGPFMVRDHVASSSSTVVRNPDYWMTNPIGPGKGDQLPYVDKVRTFVIPDESTRLAAVRTGRLDQLLNVNIEAKDELLKSAPGIKFAKAGWSGYGSIGFNAGQVKAFADVNVRRAMMMSINYSAINKDLFGGLADLESWPYPYQKGYDDLYPAIDAPDMPAAVKELWSYQPEKSKQLLKDAGYPSGFKFDLTLLQTEADYYSIIKEYFAKVNLDMTLKIIDPGVQIGIMSAQNYQAATLRVSPPSTYPEQAQFTGTNYINHSLIKDAQADKVASETRVQAITDFNGALKATRELTKHLLGQAYVIQAPYYPVYAMYQPYLKNYDGEQTVGYFSGTFWVQYVWVDQALKTAMGR